MSDVTYLTAEIVSAAASNEASRMRPEDLVDLIRSVRSALAEEGPPTFSTSATEDAPLMAKREWSKLLSDGKIKSMIDGKMYSTLKRHIGKHGYDGKSYRAAFGLPHDFPIVSPEYSAMRSETAKRLGLGGGKKKAGDATPAKRGRPKKTA